MSETPPMTGNDSPAEAVPPGPVTPEPTPTEAAGPQMSIDVVSIFPEYLSGLQLSLIGKAVDRGQLSLRVHDLRDFTSDRHNTVDDSPYGGGAGMVMKAEPWALALEHILAVRGSAAEGDSPEGGRSHSPAVGSKPTLIVPSPAGQVFDQRIAEDLADRDHLVFACGRYEGIDQRVIDWAGEHFELLPMSIGDYVLNGGEVASMVMIEAVSRLIPVSSAIPSHWPRRVTKTGCSNTPSIRSRRTGADVRCPRSCSAATMPRSHAGDVTDVSNAPLKSDPTCSRDSMT